jgi:hypothetical protein
MHEPAPDQTQGIHNNMAFSPFHFFGGIIATRSPFLPVFTDWLSTIKALGLEFRPALRRTRSRNGA